MHVERVASPKAEGEFIAAGPDADLLRRRLDAVVEPFWAHSVRELFVLRDGRRVVGRVAAVANLRHDERHRDGAGFFSWLQCPDDADAARALLEAAGQWLRERGYRRVRGPLHLGLGEELGLLTEGFDRPAGAAVPANPPYLPGLLSRVGLSPVHERHGYAWSVDEMPPPPASLRVREERRVADRGVVYRHLDRERPGPEALRFLQAHNAAYAGRWGFVPLTEEEARARVRDVLAFGDPRLVWLAEVNGEPAGIVVTLPIVEGDADSARPSRLGPLRALRAALAKRRLGRAHLVSIAVEPRFRGLHLGGQLLLRAWRAALDLGVREAELSGVDPADEVMQHMLWRLGCRRVRRFTVYEMPLR